MVDQREDMRGFAGRPGDQTVAMAMLQHQRRKDMAVAGRQTMNIVAVKAFTLQALIEELFVLIEVAAVGGVHDFKFAHGVRKTCGFQLFLHIGFAPRDQGAAQPGTLICNGGAQHTGIIACLLYTSRCV